MPMVPKGGADLQAASKAAAARFAARSTAKEPVMKKPALPTYLDDFNKLLDAAVADAPRSDAGRVDVTAAARGILGRYSIPAAVRRLALESWLADHLLERLGEQEGWDDDGREGDDDGDEAPFGRPP
jgi:hypothetical protein